MKISIKRRGEPKRRAFGSLENTEKTDSLPCAYNIVHPILKRMSRTDRMMPTSRALRSDWSEPLLAALALTLTTVLAFVGSGGATYWFINALPFLSTAFAKRFVWQSAVLTTCLALLGLCTPTENMGIGAAALLIHVFTIIRLRIKHATWWTTIWIIIMLEIAMKTPNSSEIPIDVASLFTGSAIAVGGAMLLRSGEERVATTEELGRQKLISYRFEMARELHDTVAQTLSHTAMRAHLALTHPDLPEKVRVDLERIAFDCNTSAYDLRNLISSLRTSNSGGYRTPPSDITTLAAETKREVDRLERAGFSPEVTIDIRNITPTRALTLSKITHEAVTNMIKHSPPRSSVSIILREERGELIAEYVNPDSGKKENRNRLGLLGVQERIRQLRGSFEVDRNDGLWRTIAVIPQPPASLSGNRN